MLSFKCKICGGELSVSRTGDLVCSYCGSHSVFSDRQLAEYREFRGRMLTYLSAVANKRADSSETDLLWGGAAEERLETVNGSPVSVTYLWHGVQDGIEIYTARRSVVFVFPHGQEKKTERFIAMPARLEYPSADVRSLAQYFPVLSGDTVLRDGRRLVACAKNEELFPLAAFGSLPPAHAAWIVSRLENLCCVLAFSDLRHGGIGEESVFINARTHEAFLLGGWWNAVSCAGGSADDLRDIRKTAARVMGVQKDGAPKQFLDFISGAPAKDAFSDFARWDRVIESGFGGRKFEKLDLRDLKII